MLSKERYPFQRGVRVLIMPDLANQDFLRQLFLSNPSHKPSHFLITIVAAHTLKIAMQGGAQGEINTLFQISSSVFLAKDYSHFIMTLAPPSLHCLRACVTNLTICTPTAVPSLCSDLVEDAVPSAWMGELRSGSDAASLAHAGEGGGLVARAGLVERDISLC